MPDAQDEAQLVEQARRASKMTRKVLDKSQASRSTESGIISGIHYIVPGLCNRVSVLRDIVPAPRYYAAAAVISCRRGDMVPALVACFSSSAARTKPLFVTMNRLPSFRPAGGKAQRNASHG